VRKSKEIGKRSKKDFDKKKLLKKEKILGKMK